MGVVVGDVFFDFFEFSRYGGGEGAGATDPEEGFFGAIDVAFFEEPAGAARVLVPYTPYLGKGGDLDLRLR